MPMSEILLTIGLISDTHGLLRKSVAGAFSGVDMILHAGDIDRPEVLADLNRIAPVTAVLGNMDRPADFAGRPRSDLVDAAGFLIYLIHDLSQLDLDPAAAGCAAVVYGHSHRPDIRKKEGVFYINPGSAGPRRFRLPISAGIIEITADGLHPRIIELKE